MRKVRRVGLCLSLITSLLATPAVAYAQGAENDAGAHFERGVSFFKDKNFTAAMVEFKRAYEIDPNWVVLYNIGWTARELQHYSEALDALERFLQEGGAQVEADQKKQVDAWVAELKQKVGTFTFKTNVDGVEVAVDDVVVGVTPLPKGVTVDAGRRKISVSKGGYAPITRFVDIAGTETKTVQLDLVSLTAEGPGPGPTGPQEIEHTPWPWVGLGVTAAFGIATGVVGGLAFSKKAAFDDALTVFPTDPETIDDARSEARTFATTADVLGGLTAGFAVLTVIAFAVDYSRSPPSAEDEKKDEPETVTVRPVLGPTFGGISGTF